MLYDRWRAIAANRQSETALWETGSGRRWTFGQLDRAAGESKGLAGPVAFPQGHNAEFVLAVLVAWRRGQVVCPLELGQEPPQIISAPPWCAHLKTTSATTGQARLIAFRAAQLAADPAQLVTTMGLRPDWPNLAVISLAHSYGFSSLVLPLLLHGIPLIIVPSPLPELLRAAARNESALTLPAVPTLWRAWDDAGCIPPSVRLALSAGAPLPLALEQRVFARHGLKIHNFYGSSECGGIAYDRGEEPRTEASLAGTAVDGVRLAAASDGCLEVRGPHVAESYWPEPMDTLGHGLFHTADLAECRGAEVHLLGRASEVINVAGRKVAPETIERALLAHPAVREALVVDLPSPTAAREVVIGAAVVAVPPVPEAELRRFLLERLPAWQVPRAWLFVDALPVNQRGKLSRAEWRQRFAAS
jgi:acyl-coenzyme A synthetase/AMP-(fatty) acid ligase